MHPTEYANIATHEQTYWWFVAKRRLVNDIIGRYCELSSASMSMLDLGCGPGGNLSVLNRHTTQAIGLDFSPYALSYAHQHHEHLGQASILNIPLPDSSIDLITVLDVLYHQWIPDDMIALRECHRILKSDGVLIITDSAFAMLGGPHDAANMTARRYSLPQMQTKLTHLGFEILKSSYVYSFLFPVALIRRWMQRTFATGAEPASDIQGLPSWLNNLLLTLSTMEQSWLKSKRMPFGTSILFVVRKV